MFPRATSATPIDALSYIGDPPLFRPKPRDIDAVHVSVTFTWDKQEGLRLFHAWEQHYPGITQIGGPAFDHPGFDFEPGRYLKPGHTITSRGCPNHCGFCFVPAREGPLRELAIHEGSVVHDNNLTACSPRHIEQVFRMLRSQGRVSLKGGLEAARVLDRFDWWVDLLRSVSLNRVYFACDRQENVESVKSVVLKLVERGFTRDRIGVYVLAGWNPDDTPGFAEARCRHIYTWGALPFMMVWVNKDGKSVADTDYNWKLAQRRFTRPAITKSVMKEEA